VEVWCPLKLLSHFEAVGNIFILKRTIVDGLRAWPVFEDYRSNYVFISLFDTHYLLIWLLTLASVLSLYFTLLKFTVGRVTLTAFLYATTTFLHVY